MTICEQIRQDFESHLAMIHEAMSSLVPGLEQAAERILECYRHGGKIILMGNGGSAADAQHLAAELLGRYQRERPPLPALALNTNSSTLTAIANDYGFEEVFTRQLHALAQPGDVVIGLSTSGKSANIISALRWARSLPCHTMAMTGGDCALIAEAADIVLAVPSLQTARIQECHILLGHALCGVVESRLAA